jgi:ABC-type polysaccharide/polyol phosphate transport system ATPase subunit
VPLYRHACKALQFRNDGTIGLCSSCISDPEILVIDEVLAVGDAEFKKAIGKMQDISEGGKNSFVCES